jgi:hypothetical protein
MVAAILVSCLSLGSTQAQDVMLPTNVPDFPALIAAHGDVLAEVMSDKGAVNFFVTTLGPALHLNEVSNTLGAKNIPAKLSKELLVEELTTAAVRLVGALAAWRAVSGAQQPPRDGQATGTAERVPAAPLQRDWLGQRGMPLTEIESLQAAYREWDRLRGWKDRVRLLRGQGRLCGTWQWVVHNHQQHHREQKLSLLFPPPGPGQAGIVGLVETIVLGDNVYLRWEIDGRVQEDSLQFTKEGQRLEGTFVNSQGGWGSISGKKTSNCAP